MQGVTALPIEQSRDTQQFAAFERSGWDSNIAGYDAAFGALTRQTAGATLDAAGVTPGMPGVGICCGPRMLAAGAAGNGAPARRHPFSTNSPAPARRRPAQSP